MLIIPSLNHMRKLLLHVYALFLTVLLTSLSGPDGNIIATGKQPRLSIDSKGVVRTVFGRNDSIFCATSKDAGTTFSKPVWVGEVSQMHLGMGRGPQLASSEDFSIITAMDKSGNIHYFQLDHATGKWSRKGLVNDIPASAPKG
jgi:hypothetical protein